MRPQEIASATNQGHDAVRYLLGQMVKAGEVRLIKRGQYVRAA